MRQVQAKLIVFFGEMIRGSPIGIGVCDSSLKTGRVRLAVRLSTLSHEHTQFQWNQSRPMETFFEHAGGEKTIRRFIEVF
jgi:hypothetical protein